MKLKLSRNTFKRKFITEHRKQKLKLDIGSINNPLATKNTKMTLNYRMNSVKLKLQQKK